MQNRMQNSIIIPTDFVAKITDTFHEHPPRHVNYKQQEYLFKYFLKLKSYKNKSKHFSFIISHQYLFFLTFYIIFNTLSTFFHFSLSFRKFSLRSEKKRFFIPVRYNRFINKLL